MNHPNTDTTVLEDRLECAESQEASTCTTQNRTIPIAYEEVALTEEAAAILEQERQAAAQRPARKLRRMATVTPATPSH